MSKYFTLVAILIGLMIVVAFYLGSTNLVATVGNVFNQLILTLQGRTSSGSFANYPAQRAA